MNSLTIVATNKNRMAVDSKISEFFFKSLCFQEYKEFEVIIIDGGSDNYDQLREHFESDNMRFMQHKIEGKFKRALLLNMGICVAQTPYVMCTDVDMLLYPKFLSTLMENVSEKSFVVSRTMFLTNKSTRRIYKGKYKFFADDPNYNTYGRLKRRTTCGGCQCTHINNWNKLRGYNETYEGYGSEDNDMLKRANLAGLDIVWLGDTSDKVMLFHQFHERNKLAQFADRDPNRLKYWDVKSTHVNPEGWGTVKDKKSTGDAI